MVRYQPRSWMICWLVDFCLVHLCQHRDRCTINLAHSQFTFMPTTLWAEILTSSQTKKWNHQSSISSHLSPASCLVISRTASIRPMSLTNHAGILWHQWHLLWDIPKHEETAHLSTFLILIENPSSFRCIPRGGELIVWYPMITLDGIGSSGLHPSSLTRIVSRRPISCHKISAQL